MIYKILFKSIVFCALVNLVLSSTGSVEINSPVPINSQLNYDFNGVFIFCADMLADAVVKVFNENKILVNTIYDDDLNFKGKKISNIPIKKLPKNDFSASDCKKIFIICNFDKKIFSNIKIKLIKKRFPKKRILHLSF